MYITFMQVERCNRNLNRTVYVYLFCANRHSLISQSLKIVGLSGEKSNKYCKLFTVLSYWDSIESNTRLFYFCRGFKKSDSEGST